MMVSMVKTALGALTSQKRRSLLATTGVVIGVCALMVMISVGQGAKMKVLKEFESMGKNLILVSAGKVSIRGGRLIQRETATTLTQEDAWAIESKVPDVAAVAPIYDNFAIVERGRVVLRTRITGTTPPYTGIRNFHPVLGRFFNWEEVRGRVRVAVLGASVARRLFGALDPVGREIRIRRVPFKVIGVMESKGVDASGEDQDDQILIPITTAVIRVFHVTYVNTILVQARTEAAIPRVSRDIRRLLRARHRLGKRPDDFSINAMEDVMREKAKAASIFAVLVAAVAAVSLVVGAIGVLAVMLLSVRERVQEIGIRRAVGATRRAILFQFLVESMVLALAGGGIGVFLGTLFSLLIALLAKWQLILPFKGATVGVVVSVITGVLSGLYPAFKASRIHPIQALRL